MSSNLVDLTKKVKVVLEKRGMKPNVKAQVGFATDISGSIKPLFMDGTMQEIVNRLQALAIRFDDNETLDMWAFHSEGFELPAAVPSMFGTYVVEHILTRRNLWGSTSFAPVTRMIDSHYFGSTTVASVAKAAGGLLAGALSMFGKKTSEPTTTVQAPASSGSDPVYLIFLTDGDNDDEGETTTLIEHLTSKNIYIQFVGIGRGSNFRYIKRMADDYGHVGFVDFSNPSAVSDEQMYEALLNDEFVKWMNSRAGA